MLGVQVPVLIMIAGFVISYLVLRKTSFGLRVYAVGGNRTAADVAGVKSGQILTSVYVLSGALAGLSGVILSSRVISGPPNLGSGLRTRRHRRRRHRRRQPARRPRIGVGHPPRACCSSKRSTTASTS